MATLRLQRLQLQLTREVAYQWQSEHNRWTLRNLTDNLLSSSRGMLIEWTPTAWRRTTERGTNCAPITLRELAQVKPQQGVPRESTNVRVALGNDPLALRLRLVLRRCVQPHTWPPQSKGGGKGKGKGKHKQSGK